MRGATCGRGAWASGCLVLVANDRANAWRSVHGLCDGRARPRCLCHCRRTPSPCHGSRRGTSYGASRPPRRLREGGRLCACRRWAAPCIPSAVRSSRRWGVFCLPAKVGKSRPLRAREATSHRCRAFASAKVFGPGCLDVGPPSLQGVLEAKRWRAATAGRHTLRLD